MKKNILCNIDEIEAMKPKEFTVGEGDDAIELFVILKNNTYYAYKNSCPHARVNLNWNKDQFLDYFESVIQCSLHFAQFTIETGHCFQGPCKGQSLQKLKLLIEQDKIFLLH